uniref:Uncharacterized protein n=1 Tax=Human betaherpesvirus 6 TaxID=10368 RepID=A0A1W6J525_9BETA|nr:hypothetical protein [Human betaherpesvirus 6]ARM61296.1 hypothetical protein [Human betaherpesvirus 6]QFV26185.1 hypothetical protein [Human betaherpesvirus 6]QFV47776.1 hypothetical protein [Human betaherpesvirus 6]QFX16095.1 hypothetical protein [Human betaherpesvirus 6]
MESTESGLQRCMTLSPSLPGIPLKVQLHPCMLSL